MPKITDEAKKKTLKALTKTGPVKKLKRKLKDLAPGSAKIGVALAKAAMDKKIKGKLKLGKNVRLKGEISPQEKKIEIQFNKGF